MEEVGDDLSDGLLVVDECFENLGLTVRRDDVVIGNGSWHETGVAFGYGYFITGGADLELAVTIEHHEDDEAGKSEQDRVVYVELHANSPFF